MNSPKPTVICHMMATIDGRITSGTGVDIMDDYFELYTQTEDELHGDSWMCGRVTMEMFAKGEKIELGPSDNTNNFSDHIDNKSEHGYFIGIDTKGKLRWDKNAIKLSNYEHPLPIVIVVTKETSGAYLSYLRDLGINYIFGGDSKVEWAIVMEKLSRDMGIQRLLLEGGGNLNGSLLAQDLVDEISLMVVPTVLNRSTAPTIFENETNEINLKKFNLTEVKQIDKDCVWLKYTKAS